MQNEVKLSPAMIIGGLVAAVLIIFIIVKVVGNASGGATVNTSVGGPPAYAEKAKAGATGAATGYKPNITPPGSGSGRPSYGGPGGGAPSYAPPGPGGGGR